MKMRLYATLALVICYALWLGMPSVSAQERPFGPDGPRDMRSGQDGPMEMRKPPQQERGIAITTDATHIYIVMEMVLYKISKATMEVEKTLFLPHPRKLLEKQRDVEERKQPKKFKGEEDKEKPE